MLLTNLPHYLIVLGEISINIEKVWVTLEDPVVHFSKCMMTAKECQHAGISNWRFGSLRHPCRATATLYGLFPRRSIIIADTGSRRFLGLTSPQEWYFRLGQGLFSLPVCGRPALTLRALTSVPTLVPEGQAIKYQLISVFGVIWNLW